MEVAAELLDAQQPTDESVEYDTAAFAEQQNVDETNVSDDSSVRRELTV